MLLFQVIIKSDVRSPVLTIAIFDKTSERVYDTIHIPIIMT